MEKLITNILFIIVTFIVLFGILSGSADVMIDSAENVSGSGLPLAAIFSPSGVFLLAFMASLAIFTIYLAFQIKV